MQVRKFGFGLSKIRYLSMILILFGVGIWSSPSLARSIFIDAHVNDLRGGGQPLPGDINVTNWAQAARAANEFCKGEGYLGGIMNGHQGGDMRGVTCVDSTNSTFIDTSVSQLRRVLPLEGDINKTNWAQAARAANEFCKSKGLLAGWMNGHQFQNKRGVLCVNSKAAQFMDGTLKEFRSLGFPIDDDIDKTNWAQAARSANEFCKSKGFVGGRLNGHFYLTKRGVICLKS